MSVENNSFHAVSGSWYWQEPDYATKEKIQNKLIEDNKKGIMTGFVFIFLSIIMVIYGLFCSRGGGFFDRFERGLFIGVGLFMIIVMTSNLASTSRYLRKARDGHFLCRHVEIDNTEITTNGITNKLVVWIRSDDERMEQATVDMEVYAKNKLVKGQHGMFVMIEDEKRKLMVSPFWFIKDIDLGNPYEDM